MTLYLILAVLAAISTLMISENYILGRMFEVVFRLRKGSFYSKHEKHAKLVALFKWPFLLALFGLVVPTIWSFDFILTFLVGILIEWWNFRRPAPKLLEVEREVKELDLTAK